MRRTTRTFLGRQILHEKEDFIHKRGCLSEILDSLLIARLEMKNLKTHVIAAQEVVVKQFAS